MTMSNQDHNPALLRKRLTTLEILVSRLQGLRLKDRRLIEQIQRSPNPYAAGMADFMMLDGSNKPTLGNWTFGFPVTIDTDITNERTLDVQRASGQTSDIFTVRTEGGADLFVVDATGDVFVAWNRLFVTQGALSVANDTPSTITALFQGATSQTALNLDVRDSTSTSMFAVDHEGDVTWGPGGVAYSELGTNGTIWVGGAENIGFWYSAVFLADSVHTGGNDVVYATIGDSLDAAPIYHHFGLARNTTDAVLGNWIIYMNGQTGALEVDMAANDTSFIQGAPGQSSNIFELQISGGSVKAYFDSAGKFGLASGTSINEISIDGTMAGNSDDAAPTEKAVKTYVDARLPTGSILAYGSTTAPSGYLKCDGTAVSRTTYAALFAVIGTTFGVGNGSTTFNVPDLNARSPMGAGAEAGLTTRTIGAKLGAESDTHTHNLDSDGYALVSHQSEDAELHTKEVEVNSWTATNASSKTATTPGESIGQATELAGATASDATPIVHPVQVVQFIIKT
jgi:microcystin-dependent protein